MQAEDGTAREWYSAVLPRYARRTRQLEALIAGTYLAGTNTRRVQRALGALFRGAVGKDVVSRAWRKVKVGWEAWGKRDLAGKDIVRLGLDGTVVRVRLDRKATSISLLVVLGARSDGQKVLLGGKAGDAVWVGLGGQQLTAASLGGLVRLRSSARFGRKHAFGPHHFRHCIGTTGPMADPSRPGVSAAVLGVGARVHEKHYDRGKRAAAGQSFNRALDLDREEAREVRRRLVTRAKRPPYPDAERT